MHSLYVMFLIHIMCNVAALTFYATIYEDICCTCNKYIEKHVLGTASSAVICVSLTLCPLVQYYFSEARESV